jgi:hypothetical protein
MRIAIRSLASPFARFLALSVRSLASLPSRRYLLNVNAAKTEILCGIYFLITLINKHVNPDAIL